MAATTAAIAVCVTVFIVVATFAFVVEQRSRELALLRLTGAPPRQVRPRLPGLFVAIGSGNTNKGKDWCSYRGCRATVAGSASRLLNRGDSPHISHLATPTWQGIPVVRCKRPQEAPPWTLPRSANRTYAPFPLTARPGDYGGCCIIKALCRVVQHSPPSPGPLGASNGRRNRVIPRQTGLEPPVMRRESCDSPCSCTNPFPLFEKALAAAWRSSRPLPLPGARPTPVREVVLMSAAKPSAGVCRCWAVRPCP